ncbi:Chitodextrinase [Pedobacter sp. Bi27]|uniref:Ig-like domain-containing protein n=1 Tax=Pedobacter sp. Bi27 TaxID=2822351 RepID=UPI001D4ABD72|nr:Ig-like domain-containing protein [Pedobacter sp. Bi27]CAH0316712.1 Chitodextrinase [Pedobacter sp. Bi27]
MKKRLLSFLAMLLLCAIANAQNPVTITAAASKRPSQSGSEITKAFDGNLTTMYHSNWSLNAMPDTVDFYFVGVKSINKVDYTPRQSGPNGIWTTVDVYYASADAPSVFVSKLSNISWAQTNAVKTIDMTASPIVKPYIVRFVIRAAGGNFSSCAEINFSSAETGPFVQPLDCDNPIAEDFTAYSDVKLAISSASVSPAANGGEDISRTYDNNTATLYHSSYSGGGFPISLTYNFTTSPTIDYISYVPRQDGGSNGIFGTGEIWYKTTTQTTLTKLMNFDTGFSSAAYQISFPAALTNVTQVVVKVLTGKNNFASCAEMQFYQKNSAGNLYTNIFADDLHTTLKSGITQTDIDAIASPFFKSLAQCIFNNSYNRKYRVQTYDYYPNPVTVEGILKINGLNKVENPTGIAFKANTKAIVFVGDTYGVNPQLVVKDFGLDYSSTTDSYPLKKGVNIINVLHDGLAYIGYFSDNINLQPIQINITTGQVNGYYNPLTDTNDDWTKMLLNGVYSKLDMKGIYTNLNLNKNILISNSAASGKELVAAYDTIVHNEFTLNGLTKYNRVPKNHMFLRSITGDGNPNASGEGVNYPIGVGGSGSNLASATGVFKDPWGIAHEYGHNNQVRPGAKWIGMTEVTNNVNSAWIQYLFSTNYANTTRLEKGNDAPKAGAASLYGGRYGSLFDNCLIQKKHMEAQGDVFVRLVPLWQLEVYYQLAGAGKNLPTMQQRLTGTAAPAGQPDVAFWYGDVLEKMRTTSQTGLNEGQLLLNFVSATCDAVQEDLTDFFVKSGYLLPIDMDIDDYSIKRLTITQAQIDALIATIQAKGYPKPVSPVLNYISANTINTFKNRTPLATTAAATVGVTVNTNTLKIDNSKWANAVAFETYNQKVLTDVAIYGAGEATTANANTTVQYGAGSTSVYAVGVDGTRKLVYPAVDVANVLPTVSITSPVNNAVVTVGSDVVINADAADTDGTVTKVEFYQGSTLLGQSTTAPYNFTWTNPVVGNYNLTAKATDNNGGVKVSDTVKVIINTLPTVAISSPANHAVFTAGINVVIDANAADTDGTIAKVEFYQGSTLLGESTAAPYSFTWTNPAIGNYNLTAKATDNNGGIKVSDTVKVVINTLPTVAISSPASHAVFTAGMNVTINANAADIDGTISKVEFYQGSTLLGESTAAPYSFNWNNPTAGNYSLTAKATDNNGGTTISDTVKVTINTLPTVAISSPTGNAVYTAGANVVLNANAADTDGTISKVEFFEGNTLLGQSITAPYSFTWNNPGPRFYNITAKVTDNNGGTAVADTVRIKINATPTVAITSPANNTVFIANSNVTIKADAADTDGTISKVEFYQGSTLLGQSTTAPYNFTWASPASGSYALTAKATDNNGGTTTSTAVNVTANTLPTVAISSPANNAVFTTGSNVVISANAADTDGTITKVEFYQGSTLLGQSTTAPYSYTWTSPAAGSYALTAKATDNNGGTTISAIVNISVSAAPTVSITAPVNNAIFAANSNITINASTTGTVVKVEFYKGSTLLGQSTTAPYNMVWNNVSSGTYTLTAKATDNLGRMATSSPVTVTVNTPQALTVNPVADAFVRDGVFANANNGSSKSLDVSSDNWSAFRESYLRFNYSTFSGSAVNSAKIRVYASRIEVNPSRNVSVYGLSNTTWGEGTITWNNKPTESGTLLGNYIVKNTARAWYELDVTAYINSQLALGKKIISIRLINQEAKGSGNLVSFNSREANSNKPELLLNQEAGATNFEEWPINTNNGKALGSLLALTVTAWPNPSTTGFKVQAESPSSDALQYRVYNIAQQLVKEAKIAVNEQLTFGTELPAGVYMVEVRQGTERKVVKVIKL